MVHRCDPRVVNQNVEAFLSLPDMREHVFDPRFISNVEAVVSIIRKFPFERRPTASKDLVLPGRVMLDQGTTEAPEAALERRTRLEKKLQSRKK